MSLLETIKHTFVSEHKAVYRCDDCGEVMEVDADASAPSCSSCGSDDVTMINQV
ncbi:MAG: hypothetical protein ABEH47_02225 [Haloferacaceae archaeon]